MTSEELPGGWREVRLSYTPPYDTGLLLTYLRGHAIAGIEEVTSEEYRRSLGLSDVRGVMEVRVIPDAPEFLLRLRLDEETQEERAIECSRWLLDLSRDPHAICMVLRRDPLLAPSVAARPGLRVAGTVDGFELAVRAVVGQQVSVAGACTLIGRLVRRLGEPLETPVGAVTHTFPTSRAMADGDLSGLGITGARIRALYALSRAVASDEIELRPGAETNQVVAQLESVPGIGPWTAQYIAMRALQVADACPVSDLGLRRAMEMYGLPGDLTSVAARVEAWRPWRAYGIHHMWAGLPSAGQRT